MAVVNLAARKDSVTPMKENYPGWNPIEGDPKMETFVISTAANGTMESGYWECTPGKFQVKNSAFEFLCILEGKAVITPKNGNPVTIRAGDAVSIEKEFEGTWEIVEKIRKFWSVRLESCVSEKDATKMKFDSANSVTVINPLVETVKPITENLPGWDPIKGDPKMQTYILNDARDKTMESGYWECTPGKFHVKGNEYEFLSLIEGKAIITPKVGEPVTLQAGDAVVVEKGFVGTWEIIEKIRKFWLVRLTNSNL